jgi:hypothetical protein
MSVLSVVKKTPAGVAGVTPAIGHAGPPGRPAAGGGRR